MIERSILSILGSEDEQLADSAKGVLIEAVGRFKDDLMNLKNMTLEEFLMASTLNKMRKTVERCINLYVMDFIENNNNRAGNSKLHSMLKKDIDAFVAGCCIAFKLIKSQTEQRLKSLNLSILALNIKEFAWP